MRALFCNKAIDMLIDSQISSHTNLSWHFAKSAYLLSCWELDEKTDTAPVPKCQERFVYFVLGTDVTVSNMKLQPVASQLSLA